MTVLAIVLLLGASQVSAEDAAKSSGESPFAQVPGFQSNASYSCYVGDDDELKPPPDAAAPASDDPFKDDLLKAKHGTAQKSSKKGGRELSVKDDETEQPMVYGPWVSFEYLSTWLEGRFLPPLVSTSPPGSQGVVPGADVLFGGEDVSGGRQAAGKLSLGAWLDRGERLGIGGSFFLVQTETVRFARASEGDVSAGDPVLARPFYETWPGPNPPPSIVGPASFMVAGQRIVAVPPFIPPTVFTWSGDIQAVTHTDVLGADGYLRYLLYCAPGRRVDLIGGYQFSRVDDNLQISHRSDIFPATFGSHLEAEDVFDTVNKFHGGELGLLGEFGKGPIRLSILAKVGLGNMNEVVTITGRSSLTDVGGNVLSFNDGILALPTNIGVYEQDKFAVIPELDAKLIFKLTQHLEVSVGYNFIYWSTLALAGDQIETINGLPAVNSSQWSYAGYGYDPAGGAHPNLGEIKDSSLWLQGLSVGLTLRR